MSSLKPLDHAAASDQLELHHAPESEVTKLPLSLESPSSLRLSLELLISLIPLDPGAAPHEHLADLCLILLNRIISTQAQKIGIKSTRDSTAS